MYLQPSLFSHFRPPIALIAIAPCSRQTTDQLTLAIYRVGNSTTIALPWCFLSIIRSKVRFRFAYAYAPVFFFFLSLCLFLPRRLISIIPCLYSFTMPDIFTFWFWGCACPVILCHVTNTNTPFSSLPCLFPCLCIVPIVFSFIPLFIPVSLVVLFPFI